MEAAYSAPAGDRMALSQFDYADPNGIVLATHQITPASGPSIENLHPAGVEFDGTRWVVRNLDGGSMPATAFNVMAPLAAP